MKPVVGIVAEHNPLHNGHRLHMAAARAALGEAPCVIVLSSNFTQRGEPALADKWARAGMGLACGADLVLELPFPFACAAAPNFSSGALDIVARSHLVTHLSFGMENPRHEMEPIVDILAHEPPAFKQRLREELGRGLSWPRAMACALEAILPGSAAFASHPNNLLALSYLLHMRKKGYPLTPLPIQRQGEAHDSAALGPLASAGALRDALNLGASLNEDSPLAEAMPASSIALLREAHDAGRLCLPQRKEGLWPMLQALLLRASAEELRRFDGMDEGIERRLLKEWRNASGFEDFVGLCASPRYTRSRVRRLLIRLLVGMDRWTADALRRLGPPYARVLGFTERGRELLRVRGNRSGLPFITRLPAAQGSLGRAVAELEFRASALYELLLPQPDLRHEERQSPASPM